MVDWNIDIPDYDPPAYLTRNVTYALYEALQEAYAEGYQEGYTQGHIDGEDDQSGRDLS